MPFSPDDKFGPYTLISLLGEGGMGEVWKACDTRLDRTVALKIAKADFTARFEREAHTIAQLNHPHICTLHDVGPNYLVMELVEGETLAARLKKGALPLAQVVRFGVQVADAIAAAHARGIIHRDLKPGNVMGTKFDVKVLDFGLAKTSFDETQTLSKVAVGTPAYMAPEQRDGRKADARTDIYALGLLLAEMATGKRAPAGERPALGSLPEAFAHVVERCLEDDPDLRWQSARDLKAELEWAGKSQPAVTPAVSRGLPHWMLAIAALALAGAGATAVLLLRHQPVGVPLASQFRLELGQSRDEAVSGGINTMPMPSPDGRYLLIAGNDARGGPVLWLRPFDSEAARLLAGTEGAVVGAFWSPDGQWIGFYAGGKLKKIRPGGGAPQTIASLPSVHEATWGAKGDILVRPRYREPLYRISESGGLAEQVTHLDESRTENSHRYHNQCFLPDGRRFLFTARCGQRENNALYIGSLDTGKVKRLMRIDSQARYVPVKGGGPGLLVYYLDGALVSRVFDLDREEVSGEPTPVYQGVAYAAASLAAFFSISGDGRVAVIRSGGASQMQLMWFDRSGEPAGTLGPRGEFIQPRISPDGSRVAVAGLDPQTGNRDLFVIEVARGTSSRLTTHVANDWYPVWSPDGKQVLFGSDRGGTEMRSFLKRSLEPSAEETRFPGQDPTDWSHDGRWIAFGTSGLGIAPAAPDGEPFVYLAPGLGKTIGRFSPNGRWLAYASNESGQFDVYVRPFAGRPAPAEGKIQISAGGGDFPVWRRDGRELYYMGPDGTIFAVDTQALERNAAAPNATRLFRACSGSTVQPLPGRDASYGQPYDTVDGKRFLITCAAEPPGRYTVLLNWPFGKS